MIFNSSKDIKDDILNKILNHVLNENNTSIKNILSLVRSYFHELHIRKEISEYSVSGCEKYNIIGIFFNFKGNAENLKINLCLEMRKLKIKKINKNLFLIT